MYLPIYTVKNVVHVSRVKRRDASTHRHPPTHQPTHPPAPGHWTKQMMKKKGQEQGENNRTRRYQYQVPGMACLSAQRVGVCIIRQTRSSSSGVNGDLTVYGCMTTHRLPARRRRLRRATCCKLAPLQTANHHHPHPSPPPPLRQQIGWNARIASPNTSYVFPSSLASLLYFPPPPPTPFRSFRA